MLKNSQFQLYLLMLLYDVMFLLQMNELFWYNNNNSLTQAIF